jgi:phosphatidylserine/phosphatidylglycerophosphate/cardiolipin synthase-like enzyme
MPTSQFDQGPWARTAVAYPPRPGNSLRILIDGQAAYEEIAAAFNRAQQFIYLAICYGHPDFLPVPATMETFFDILRSRRQQGVDVRLVIWQPSFTLPGTLPMGEAIAGVNEGADSIQARWDRAMGYTGWYFSPRGNLRPFYLFSGEARLSASKSLCFGRRRRRSGGLCRRYQPGSVSLGYTEA